MGFLLLAYTFLAAQMGIIDANSYKENSDLQYSWATSLINGYEFRGDEKVLDVGSGDGRVSVYLAKQLSEGSVIGVDLSKSMVDLATQNFPEVYNLNFENRDTLQLDYQGKFDLAVSFCALHWVVEQKKALENIFNALKPGGKIFFLYIGESITNLGPNTFELASTKKWAGKFPDPKTTKIHYSKEGYRGLLEECGFRDIAIREEFSSYLFESQESFVNWLRPLITECSHLEEELQNAFLSELADQLIDKSVLLPSGDILVPFVGLIVEAKKP